MKNSIKTFITGIIIICGLFASVSARADDNPRLTGYFTQKISQMNNSVKTLSTADDDPTMEIQDMNIDIAPSVSFGISSVLSLTVSPEINFVLVYEDAN